MRILPSTNIFLKQRLYILHLHAQAFSLPNSSHLPPQNTLHGFPSHPVLQPLSGLVEVDDTEPSQKHSTGRAIAFDITTSSTETNIPRTNTNEAQYSGQPLARNDTQEKTKTCPNQAQYVDKFLISGAPSPANHGVRGYGSSKQPAVGLRCYSLLC